MATSLADIRARLAAQDNKSSTKGANTQQDSATYPHWNMDEGSTAVLRFLPDGNPKNEFFWAEKQIIKLPFNGIVGKPESKQTIVQVPCVEAWGGSCPVLAEVRPWYKDESLKEMANKYWKKRSYIFQGFVRQNPIGDDKTPANPIRRFIISPQIIPIIKAGLMDPEIMELPTDYTRGLDFNVKKTSKGGYADYSTSNWARRESALTEVEQAAIAAHGLFDLSDFIGKKPSDAELRIIKEMFEASVDGQPFDNERWGQYYRPWGLDAPTTTANAGSTYGTRTPATPTVAAPTVTPVTTPTVDYTSATPVDDTADEVAETSAPVVTPTPSSDKARDILAMIRDRQQNRPA